MHKSDPDLTCLLLTIQVLVKSQGVVSSITVTVETSWNFHEHLTLNVCLWEGKDKINLL
jgi:hypothetical protein